MPETRLTTRGLNRAALGRQMLLSREPLDIANATARIVGLQAQEPASPYLALWNRVEGFDPATLDAAFADGMIVKSNAVRMTLHATIADDYPTFREATEPSIRAARLHDRRFAASGLTPEDADALAPEIVSAAVQLLPADELRAWLDDRLGTAAHPGAWWGLRQYAPLLRAPTGEAWSFGQRLAYVAPRAMPVLADPEVAAESLKMLVLRYLAGFGPASVADVAQFAMVQRGRARAAIRALANAVVRLEGPAGEELFDIPDGELPDEDAPAPPRLLGMWDNLLLAYAVRDRVIPPGYRKHVIRVNGDTLPTLLVDGFVAGVWRMADGSIEATAFHPLPDDVWDSLAAEARSLMTLLAGRDSALYGRYGHWWTKLPGGEARLLPGD
ncbi:MAG TPA: winged helix DNA-binding domain-containing protein [Thermomicrobiales bacterium]|nr:winged helix DNA-binding domain-containing protein [Thermomicrobiales bacterium]